MTENNNLELDGEKLYERIEDLTNTIEELKDEIDSMKTLYKSHCRGSSDENRDKNRDKKHLLLHEIRGLEDDICRTKMGYDILMSKVILERDDKIDSITRSIKRKRSQIENLN
jgi:hypothetical protein